MAKAIYLVTDLIETPGSTAIVLKGRREALLPMLNHYEQFAFEVTELSEEQLQMKTFMLELKGLKVIIKEIAEP